MIKSLQEEYGGIGYLRLKELGVFPIEVDKIIGSVGRPQDLDDRFRFKTRRPTQRYLGIKKAMEDGKILPPIEVYRIRDEYYVLDGHHRVAAAKELHQRYIDAKVTQATPLKPKKEDIVFNYRESFRERTGLDIELTEIGGYENLISQINQYVKESGIPFEEASRRWYREIFLPVCEMIKRERIDRLIPDKTIGDLFIYISTHKWYRSEKEGKDIGFPEAVKSFKKLYNVQDDFKGSLLKRLQIRLFP
ncbi:MAG: DUF4032 domain-containing protein [bacterium]